MENSELIVLYNGKTVGLLKELSNGKIGFQYEDSWINNGFSISPFSLPLSNRIFISSSQYFEGLFGVFYDCLPDGWGVRLLIRMLSKKGIDYLKLPALAKLSLISENGGLVTTTSACFNNSMHSGSLKSPVFNTEQTFLSFFSRY